MMSELCRLFRKKTTLRTKLYEPNTSDVLCQCLTSRILVRKLPRLTVHWSASAQTPFIPAIRASSGRGEAACRMGLASPGEASEIAERMGS